MQAVVRARLSAEEQRSLAQLVQRLGWSPSRIVREGLRLMAASHLAGGRMRVAGLGRFCSTKPDVGSKKHLKGFGR